MIARTSRDLGLAVVLAATALTPGFTSGPFARGVAVLVLTALWMGLTLPDPGGAGSRRDRIALVGAALVCLVLVPSAPVFSTDVYRFAWEGKVLAHGFSPYAHPPDDPALAALRDGIHARVNHPALASLYPPLALLAFAAVSGLGIAGPKLLAALAHLGLAVTLAREESRGRTPSGAAAALVACPFLLVEGAGEGHFEALAAWPLVFSALALSPSPSGEPDVPRTPLRAAACAAVATLIKLAGVFALPSLVRRSRASALAVGGVLAATLTFVAVSASNAHTSGLASYARSWSGGAPGYALVERAVTFTLDACCVRADGRVHGALVDALPVSATALPDPYTPGPAPLRPGLHRSLAVPLASRAVAFGLVLVVFVALARRPLSPLLSLRYALLVGLAFAPRLLPWYAVLLVPVELLTGRRAGLLAIFVAWLGHAGDDPYVRARLAFDATPYVVALGLLCAFAVWREARASAGPCALS